MRSSGVRMTSLDLRSGVAAQTDVGLVVRPKRYRAVLMDQDVLHRCLLQSAHCLL